MKTLYERVESTDLNEALSALAQIVYDVSERFGGCYVTAGRCVGFDCGSATADPHGDDKYVDAAYYPHEEDKP